LCLLCLFTAPPPTGLYSLSLHDALPILMRIGLQGILGQDDRIKVVGEAASGEDAVRLSRQLKPDVVLMDLGLPGISGLQSTERIDRKSTRLNSSHVSISYAVFCLKKKTI